MKASSIVKEVSILKRLGRHPHIIALYGYYELHEKHYIVMESVTGGELFKQVELHGCLPEESARNYFRQLVSGVSHMHTHGVVHRDLKLENALLDFTEKDLKIIDFGLSHAFKHRLDGNGYEPERLKHFCGSKSYCPPEMLASVPYEGYPADVYSLGVCLFALLTGFFPLEEACPRDWRFEKLARTQLAGRSTTHKVFEFYRRPCPLSANAVAVLDAMLQLDPQKRCTLAAVIRAPWLGSKPLIADFPDNGPAGNADSSCSSVRKAKGDTAKASADEPHEVDLSTLDVPHRSLAHAAIVPDPSYYDDEDDGFVVRSLLPAPPPTPPIIQRQRAVSQLHSFA